MIGAARIVVSANGRYQPNPNGDVAVIVPVHDRDGVLDDLLDEHGEVWS